MANAHLKRKAADLVQALVDELPRLVVDENSVTTQEIVDRTGRSRTWAKDWVRKKLRAGQWEPVHKHIGPNLYTSYRKKKA